MDSVCTNRKIQSILCALQKSGIGTGTTTRYEETLEDISGDANYLLNSGSQSYTITVLQGTVDVHGTTLPEGSWTYSTPQGGSFGQVAIDASGSSQTFIQAIFPQ